MSKLENQGQLPSQPIVNPKQNASAITLRSGKELQDNKVRPMTMHDHALQEEVETEV